MCSNRRLQRQSGRQAGRPAGRQAGLVAGSSELCASHTQLRTPVSRRMSVHMASDDGMIERLHTYRCWQGTHAYCVRVREWTGREPAHRLAGQAEEEPSKEEERRWLELRNLRIKKHNTHPLSMIGKVSTNHNYTYHCWAHRALPRDSFGQAVRMTAGARGWLSSLFASLKASRVPSLAAGRGSLDANGEVSVA